MGITTRKTLTLYIMKIKENVNTSFINCLTSIVSRVVINVWSVEVNYDKFIWIQWKETTQFRHVNFDSTIWKVMHYVFFFVLCEVVYD